MMRRNVSQRPWAIMLGWMLLVTLGAPSAFAQSNDDTLEKIRATGTVTIGFRPSAYPFSFVDAAGVPMGYGIDMCKQMLEGLRNTLHLPALTVKYFSTTNADRFTDVAANKFDIECASSTDDVAQRKKVSFTIPYFVTSVLMLVPKTSPVQDWPDLQGKRVVVTGNTPAFKEFSDRAAVSKLNATIITGSDHINSFALLKSGKADAWVMNEVLLNGLRVRDNSFNDYIVRGTALSTGYMAPMVRHNDTLFRKALDGEFVALIRNGAFDATYNKWFVQQLPNGASMQMPISSVMRELMRFPINPGDSD